jgi:rod shape-determining protein MreC
LRRNSLIFHLINAAIFIALEIAALSMLRNSSSLQNTWMAKGGQAVMGGLWGMSQRVSDYFSLKQVNDSLALENFQLRSRMADLEEFISDSIRISRLPADGISRGYRYIPASISKISTNTQHNYMIISKGSDDGVVKGAGVITGSGAIGVIDGVSKNFSYARSFQNHGMSISARVGRTGISGPMTWDGKSSNGALLQEIPLHMEIAPGDTIFTSGFSSIFPPDIPLGITGESKIVNGSTSEIKVRLFEDFSALRYVTIVENLGKAEIKQLEDMR